jgi:hypothetical protein
LEAALHLIKLCVGIDSLEELERHIARRAARGEIVHGTRQTPRQRDAVLGGGSLYWVIKGVVQARQPIRDLRAETDAEGRSLCAIVLAPELIPVQPRRRRPFQGWRYLKPEDAPPDLATGDADDIPPAMRAALAELALI